MQGDLRVRLAWEVEHDRQAVVELLAQAVPADILREALTANGSEIGELTD